MAYPVASGYTSKSGTFIPEVWAKKMARRFHPLLMLNFITNTDYEGEITKHGDTVHVRYVPDVTIRDYKIGEDLTIDDINGEKASMLINKGKYYALNIEELERRQADVPFVEETLDEAALKLKAAIEKSFFAALYGDAGTDNKGATAGKNSKSFNLGTTAAPVSLDKNNVLDFIVDMGTVLDEQEIPRDGKRWLNIPPWIAGLIKKSELKNVYVTGDEKSALRTGNIGKIDDFNLFMTNFVPTDTSGNYVPTFGHKSAVSFATQFVKSDTVQREKRFGTVQRGLNVYGHKTFYPEALGCCFVKKGPAAAADSGSGTTSGQ